MIDITVWMKEFLNALEYSFGERIWFVGLQGSYGRGEASENSDIDTVVILDNLSSSDIDVYHSMLEKLPHRELICGFLSGKAELLHWETSDLFQFYHDTVPIKGSLDELIPLLDRETVRRAIRIGACNIYHGCVHNMLHEKDDEILKGLYKSASFVIQAIYFHQTGKYVRSQAALMGLISPQDQKVLSVFLQLKRGGTVCFEDMSKCLFDWTKNWINTL